MLELPNTRTGLALQPRLSSQASTVFLVVLVEGLRLAHPDPAFPVIKAAFLGQIERESLLLISCHLVGLALVACLAEMFPMFVEMPSAQDASSCLKNVLFLDTKTHPGRPEPWSPEEGQTNVFLHTVPQLQPPESLLP